MAIPFRKKFQIRADLSIKRLAENLHFVFNNLLFFYRLLRYDLKTLKLRLVVLFKGLQRRLTCILPLFHLFLSSMRDATATFESYMRGLFQSERANLLRMSEVPGT